MLKLLLLVLLVVAVVYLVRSGRLTAGSSSGPTRFQPVDQLPEATRQAIDVELAHDRLISAIKLYRDATGAGLKESKTAVETYSWRRGGPSDPGAPGGAPGPGGTGP